MIRKRDPGNFGVYIAYPWSSHPLLESPNHSYSGFNDHVYSLDQVIGPVIISALLFFAVLSNFIVRGTCLSSLWLARSSPMGS